MAWTDRTVSGMFQKETIPSKRRTRIPRLSIIRREALEGRLQAQEAVGKRFTGFLPSFTELEFRLRILGNRCLSYF